MAKTAAITIQLVPESIDVADMELKKEIAKSLRCDWLLEVLSVVVTESEDQKKT
jgi:translation elongation factor EF-1beta